VSAIATLALAYLHNLILLDIALLAGGFVWLATMSSLNAATRRSLLAKTALSASGGEFEPFKTSSIFDGTAQNPDWLGEEPQRIQQFMSV